MRRSIEKIVIEVWVFMVDCGGKEREVDDTCDGKEINRLGGNVGVNLMARLKATTCLTGCSCADWKYKEV